MGKALIRVSAALATGLIGTGLALGTHFITLSSGIARPYLANGAGLPQTPGLALGAGGLALDCLLAALPMLPVLGLCAFGGRVLVSLGFLLVWFLGGDWLGFLFAADFGTTWGFGQPFRALYLAGALSWIAAFTSLFVLWILAPRPWETRPG